MTHTKSDLTRLRLQNILASTYTSSKFNIFYNSRDEFHPIEDLEEEATTSQHIFGKNPVNSTPTEPKRYISEANKQKFLDWSPNISTDSSSCSAVSSEDENDQVTGGEKRSTSENCSSEVTLTIKNSTQPKTTTQSKNSKNSQPEHKRKIHRCIKTSDTPQILSSSRKRKFVSTAKSSPKTLPTKNKPENPLDLSDLEFSDSAFDVFREEEIEIASQKSQPQQSQNPNVINLSIHDSDFDDIDL